MKKKNGNLFCPCMLAIQNKNVGCRYGKLVVLNTFLFKEKSGQNSLRAICLCDCGKKKTVRVFSIKNGNTTSCGCFRFKLARNPRKARSPHEAKELLKAIWYSMKHRCSKPNSPRFHYYGGRGIQVCQRWQDSFEDFVEDMGPKPKGYSIDRIDNDKGYSPENCKWSSSAEQQRNKRNNQFITYKGETLCHKDWSIKLGGNIALVGSRIKRGWSVERAVTTRPTK